MAQQNACPAGLLPVETKEMLATTDEPQNRRTVELHTNYRRPRSKNRQNAAKIR
jgi:hypothetical protein